jgi:hypothetical protein
MSGGGQRHFVTINPGEMPGDGDLVHILKPSAGYGGITVVSAWARTGLVGTLNLVLQNYGTSGTVAGGTVAGMASGTATVWAVATPQELTITAANQFIDSEEWLVLKKVESAAGNDLANFASVTIEYVDGITTQG